MDATPTMTGRDLPDGGGRAASCAEAADLAPLCRKWSVLHEAAAAVAVIAGLRAEPLRGAVARFPTEVGEAGGWRCEMARQGIEDLSAMLEPGLSALLAACSRGVSCVVPAQALWREFVAARDALLKLVPPEH